MKKISLLLVVMITICISSFAQGVGIGTNSPDSSAALDVSSTSKGYLYPRMTTPQRNAIVNPADGLHIFNTDTDAPEYYSSKLKTWVCLGQVCTQKIFKVTLTGVYEDRVDVYQGHFGIDTVGMENGVLIVTVAAGTKIYSGLNVTQYPANNMKVIVYNYGNIYGIGGAGGDGEIQSQGAQPCQTTMPANGKNGSPAINCNKPTEIYNYGTIYGGGGGGAGASKGITTIQNGGGGGTGASYKTTSDNYPGQGGRTLEYNGVGCYIVAGTWASKGYPASLAYPGGKGGLGINGGSNGGDGGGWGQPGKNCKVAKGGNAGFAVNNYIPGVTKVYNLKGGTILGPVSN